MTPVTLKPNIHWNVTVCIGKQVNMCAKSEQNRRGMVNNLKFFRWFVMELPYSLRAAKITLTCGGQILPPPPQRSRELLGGFGRKKTSFDALWRELSEYAEKMDFDQKGGL